MTVSEHVSTVLEEPESICCKKCNKHYFLRCIVKSGKKNFHCPSCTDEILLLQWGCPGVKKNDQSFFNTCTIDNQLSILIMANSTKNSVISK